MSPWYTRSGTPEAIPQQGLSPTLSFQKWHAYDLTTDEKRRRDQPPPLKRPLFDKDQSRPIFLDAVARSVNDVLGGTRAEVYENWYRRYFEALEAVGVRRPDTVIAGRTLWRLVSGLGTNPALEIGLYLHPLYGFPYLPGSSVRGLVRHVAEMALLDQEVDHGNIQPLLDRARCLKALLGSLTVEPLEPKAGDSQPAETTETARRYLARLAKEPGRSDEEKAEIDKLLNQHTGGMVTFYDAVPSPRQDNVLGLDIINPHYPKYYNSQGGVPPSDDQNPNPIFFLTVSPEIEFCFPFRIDEVPSKPFQDPAGEERARNLGSTRQEDLLELVQGWVLSGLTESGAGAKTSAGYGYFQMGDVEEEEAIESTDSGSQAQAPGAQPEEPAVDFLTRIQQTVKPSAQAAPSPRPRKKATLEVVKHENGQFILRDPETKQEGIVFKDRGVRWQVGATVTVRIVRAAPDGRILEIRP